MANNAEVTQPRPRFSQEAIATIVTVGIAIAGLVLTTMNDLREEARADRAAAQATAEADRAAWQAESRQLRESLERKTEAFQREILRFTERQAALAALVSSREPENESTETVATQ